MATTVTLVGGILTITDSDNGEDALDIGYLGGDYFILALDGNPISVSIPGAAGNGTDLVTIPDTGVIGLDIDLQDGDDFVSVTSLPTTVLTGGFTLTGGDGLDLVFIDAAINTGTGNIEVDADFISLEGNADLDVTSGQVDLDADISLGMNSGSSISTVDGDINLEANQAGLGVGLVGAPGIFLENSTIETSGAGNIALKGSGSYSLAYGVYTQGVDILGSTISSTGSGTDAGRITIEGESPDDNGVIVSDSSITSVDGAIALTGESFDADALRIDEGSTISSTGTATITLEGTNNNNNDGVEITDAGTQISSVSGDIEITGTATQSDGVEIDDGAQITSTGTGATAAAITITGTTEGAQSSDDGVILDDSDSSISSVDGDIQITGTVTGPNGGDGVEADTGTSGILATGSGNINITGTTANSGQNGIEFNAPLGAASGTGSTTLNTDVLTLQNSTAPGVDLIEVNSPVGGTDIEVVNTFFENVDVNGATTPGTDYDQLQVNAPGSDIDLTGADLGIAADPGYIPASGDEITLINNVDPASTVTGTFDGLAEGDTVTINGSDFTISYQGGDGNDVVLTECFLPGTLILTDKGDRPIEELKVGDRVKTADGSVEAIKWVGRQTIDPSRVKNPLRGYPILVKAGALGNNLPNRDLYISPDHALLVEGLLINAGALVNDLSIIKTDPTEAFCYYHVELENHRLLVVEGTHAESYFPQRENRDHYDNAEEYYALYPHDNNIMLWPLDYPRVSSTSTVPRYIKKRLLTVAKTLVDQTACVA